MALVKQLFILASFGLALYLIITQILSASENENSTGLLAHYDYNDGLYSNLSDEDYFEEYYDPRNYFYYEDYNESDWPSSSTQVPIVTTPGPTLTPEEKLQQLMAEYQELEKKRKNVLFIIPFYSDALRARFWDYPPRRHILNELERVQAEIDSLLRDNSEFSDTKTNTDSDIDTQVEDPHYLIKSEDGKYLIFANSTYAYDEPVIEKTTEPTGNAEDIDGPKTRTGRDIGNVDRGF